MDTNRLTKEEKFIAYLPHGVYFGANKDIYQLTGISMCKPRRMVASYSLKLGEPMVNRFNLDGAREFGCLMSKAHLFLRPMDDCLNTFIHKGKVVNLSKDVGPRIYAEIIDYYWSSPDSKHGFMRTISDRIRSVLLHYHFDIYGMIGVHAKHISLVNEYFRRNKLTF